MDADRDCDASSTAPTLQEPTLDLTGQGALVFSAFASIALHTALIWLFLHAGSSMPGKHSLPALQVRLAAELVSAPPQPNPANANGLSPATVRASIAHSGGPDPHEPDDQTAKYPSLSHAPRVTRTENSQIREAVAQTQRDAPEIDRPKDPLHREIDPHDDFAPTGGSPGPVLLPGPHYFEPGLLTDRPKPSAEIAIEPPPGLAANSSGRMVLTLLINAEGRVDDVLGDDGTLPNDIAELARTTFRYAHFEPGKIDGIAVNSKLRIEVMIDNTLSPSSAPAGAGSQPDPNFPTGASPSSTIAPSNRQVPPPPH